MLTFSPKNNIPSSRHQTGNHESRPVPIAAKQNSRHRKNHNYPQHLFKLNTTKREKSNPILCLHKTTTPHIFHNTFRSVERFLFFFLSFLSGSQKIRGEGGLRKANRTRTLRKKNPSSVWQKIQTKSFVLSATLPPKSWVLSCSPASATTNTNRILDCNWRPLGEETKCVEQKDGGGDQICSRVGWVFFWAGLALLLWAPYPYKGTGNRER